MATAQQRANSLASQRRRYERTGRLTKGLINAGGYAAAEQRDYEVQSGDSLFSVAAAVLGSGASQSQIAAYAQEIAAANNGIQVLRANTQLRLPGAVLSPNARPTLDFMNAANAQTVAGGFTAPPSVLEQQQRELSLAAGSSTVAYSAAGFGLTNTPYAPTQATQGIGMTGVDRGNQASADRYTGLANLYQQNPSYNPQAAQNLGSAPYAPTQATQGISTTMAAQAQLSQGLSASLQARESAVSSGAFSTSSRPSSTSTPAQTEAPNPWVEQQAQQLQSIMARVDSEAPGAALPPYIPASVAASTGLYESALVQLGYYQISMTGNLYLSPVVAAAVNSGLPDISGGGTGVGDIGTVYDYNRNQQRAIGIRPFRPRRGGVGPAATSTITSDYASYGGSLSGTWRIGISGY